LAGIGRNYKGGDEQSRSALGATEPVGYHARSGARLIYFVFSFGWREHMKHALTFLLLSLITAGAAAQQQQTKTTADTKLFSSAPQNVEMKKLTDIFPGRWRTTVNVYKGDWFPADGTVEGRADIRSGPAGNSIVEQFHSISDKGNFAGHGVYWYDKRAGSYAGIWCDNMDPNACGPVGKGTWEGDNLVFNNTVDMGGPKMHIRETYSNPTKDSFDFKIETSTDSAPMKKQMSIHYVRAARGSGSSENGRQ
jgi:Protein of unknown function (DUF1579)